MPANDRIQSIADTLDKSSIELIKNLPGANGANYGYGEIDWVPEGDVTAAVLHARGLLFFDGEFMSATQTHSGKVSAYLSIEGVAVRDVLLEREKVDCATYAVAATHAVSRTPAKVVLIDEYRRDVLQPVPGVYSPDQTRTIVACTPTHRHPAEKAARIAEHPDESYTARAARLSSEGWKLEYSFNEDGGSSYVARSPKGDHYYGRREMTPAEVDAHERRMRELEAAHLQGFWSRHLAESYDPAKYGPELTDLHPSEKYRFRHVLIIVAGLGGAALVAFLVHALVGLLFGLFS